MVVKHFFFLSDSKGLRHFLSSSFWHQFGSGCHYWNVFQPEIYGSHFARGLYCLESPIVCWIFLHLLRYEQVSSTLEVRI